MQLIIYEEQFYDLFYYIILYYYVYFIIKGLFWRPSGELTLKIFFSSSIPMSHV